MTQLTEEVFERIFDKRLEGLASKADLQAIELSLDKKLKAQTKELNDYTDDKTNEVLSFLTETAAHKEDVTGLSKHMDKRFQEQAISFAFLESQVTILHKDLEQLSKRTKEDASVIVKELFKLTNRVEQLEQFVKKNKSRLLAA